MRVINPNNAIATKTQRLLYQKGAQRMKLQLVITTYSKNIFHFLIH